MKYFESTNQIQNNNTYETQSNFQWSNPISINFGLATGVIMILFYLVMDMIGHETAIYLRYFNLFFMIGASLIALRKFYQNFDRSETSYLSGLSQGFAVNIVGAFVLSAFTFIALSIGSPETGAEIISLLPIKDISTLALSFILFLETALLGLVASFVAMQFYKDNVDTPGQA